MSKIRIDSASDLEKFLKILAQESVVKARHDITEDKEQDYFEKRMQSDKVRFKPANMKEEDRDVDVTADAEEKEEIDVEQPAEEETSSEVGEDQRQITYFMIRDALNAIRSGKSLKDKETKSEMEGYIDRLSHDEKQVLFTFLNSISEIMTDLVAGTDAQDPSDPPMSLDVGKRSKPQAEKKKAPREKSGPEDTSPPIQVGAQQTESIRRKVKKLMLL